MSFGRKVLETIGLLVIIIFATWLAVVGGQWFFNLVYGG